MGVGGSATFQVAVVRDEDAFLFGYHWPSKNLVDLGPKTSINNITVRLVSFVFGTGFETLLLPCVRRTGARFSL